MQLICQIKQLLASHPASYRILCPIIQFATVSDTVIIYMHAYEYTYMHFCMPLIRCFAAKLTDCHNVRRFRSTKASRG